MAAASPSTLVTVSGLPQREDHSFVVEALCLVTGRDYATLRLPPE
jgi:uncharacterized protein (UPF0303 family)